MSMAFLFSGSLSILRNCCEDVYPVIKTFLAIFESKRETMVTIIKKGTSATEIRRKIEKALKAKRKMSIMDFAGMLKSDIDPLEYQKQIRDEWE